ncbi:MAG: hypothetical protein R2695_12140 [Acidimicrobiales bacterium]
MSMSASRPSMQASAMSRRSEDSNGITTWVSGSPKRQLNSITRGPCAVSIIPA